MNEIDKRDRFEERAAILEYDAGYSRKEAERLAWDEVYKPNHSGSSHTKAPDAT